MGATSRRILALCAALAGCLAVEAAMAAAATTDQSALSTDQSNALTEIIVTAQFRKEDLQTIPLAITAFTSQMLEDRNLTNVEDLAADSVVYAEVRFAPELHINRGLSFDEIVDSVLADLKPKLMAEIAKKMGKEKKK